MPIPVPTPIYRFIDIRNLYIYLERDRIHCPNLTPDDGLIYTPNHNEEVQNQRHITTIDCGPGGTVHDYVPCYFGYLSPMMLNLKTGRVAGYDRGQEPLIYLVSTCQQMQDDGRDFVFSDGHGLATGLTEWFCDLDDLVSVDWNIVFERYWADTNEDGDRQRRKQAEFLIHEFCPWPSIQSIGVINRDMKLNVERVLNNYQDSHRPEVVVKRGWYYH